MGASSLFGGVVSLPYDQLANSRKRTSEDLGESEQKGREATRRAWRGSSWGKYLVVRKAKKSCKERRDLQAGGREEKGRNSPLEDLPCRKSKWKKRKTKEEQELR